MADNLTTTTTVSTVPSNTIIATDDVSTVHFQKVKLADGAADSSAMIGGDATNGLDVDVTRLSALVAGTANIGDVDVLTLPALVAGTANIGDVDVLTIAAGDNNIGNVDIVTMPAVSITGTVTVDSELPTAAGLGDSASATPTTTTLASVGLVMNATTLDRQRAVVNALDSTGTGIAAAGLVGQFDDTAPSSVTENQFASLRISSRRYLVVENFHAASSTSALGASTFFNSALTNSVVNVKTSAGNLYGWYLGNTNSSVVYVQIFNSLAVNVTLGTTTPAMSLEIPATAAANLALPFGIGFGTAISVAATTTATGNSAPSSSLVVNLFYA